MMCFIGGAVTPMQSGREVHNNVLRVTIGDGRRPRLVAGHDSGNVVHLGMASAPLWSSSREEGLHVAYLQTVALVCTALVLFLLGEGKES